MMSSGRTATPSGVPRSGGDFFSNIGNPLARINSFDKLFSTAPLDDKQKNHLKYVYSLLTTGLLFAAVGSYFHLLYNVGGLLTMFATLGMIFYLGASKDPQSKDVNTRGLVFAGMCFLKGASIGPLIAQMIAVDPSLILMTLLATAGIFLSFSLAAIFAERRSMIFLGGILSSLCTVLFVSSLFNMFMHSSALFSFQLVSREKNNFNGIEIRILNTVLDSCSMPAW
eukprot:gb/GECG01005392.1/.p1 GENE.gb/GECG01005392.1/~~gb/GECG01005392.1/.p1  ORF type:complete len:226 (+),score=18.61 gb/GECG01005392.1/:1-678(+)